MALGPRGTLFVGSFDQDGKIWALRDEDRDGFAERKVVLAQGPKLPVGVDVHDDAGRVLTASFTGRRESLSDRAVLRAALGHPWQVVGVLAAIHWEAVKILLKGFGFFANPRLAKEKAAQTLVRAASRFGEKDAIGVSRRSARP